MSDNLVPLSQISEQEGEVREVLGNDHIHHHKETRR
jgi:hypothetical protein